MVASYHGHRVTLSELRRHHAISLKGTSLKAVIAISDNLGLISRPLRLEMIDLDKLKTPCILHWDLAHYVVLNWVTARWVEIFDPACGVRRLSYAETSKHFTGVALELIPAATFQKREAVERVRLTDLWSKTSGLFSCIIQILALSSLLEIFALLSPLVNQMIVDDAIAKGDLDLLEVIVIGGALLLFIQTGTTMLRGYVQMHFTTYLTFQMRGNLLRHVLRLPVPWFEKRQLGDIMSRFNSLQPVQDLLAGGLISVALDGVMAVVTLVVMMLYAPVLSGVVSVSLALFIGVRLGVFPWLKRLSAENIQYQAKVDSVFLETIRGARAFKLFGREQERHAVWQNAYADSVNNGVRIQKAIIGGTAGSSLLSGGENLIVLFLGAQAVIHGEMTLGMLIAFLSYRGQFSSAALSLVNQFFKFRMLGLHLERLADAVHQDAETGLDAEIQHDRLLNGAVEVRGVSFRYADHEPWVLRDVSVAIRPGEFVAFVGSSGGGKSTLLKVMMGLYPASSGELLVNDIPLAAFGVRAFRDRIGVVMQDDQLFAGTVADNIAFFDPEIDVNRVEEAAKVAAIHDEILRMPMGYMTLVGDLGSTLSGGQLQRILLARALYRRPAVLFLDEGTANLDILTERRIMQALSTLDMTRIVIAHRPAAIEGANRVFSVEGGAVRELIRDTPNQSLHVVPGQGASSQSLAEVEE